MAILVQSLAFDLPLPAAGGMVAAAMIDEIQWLGIRPANRLEISWNFIDQYRLEP
jgi:hypothetical protein